MTSAITKKPATPLIRLAFLTATACSLHVFESLLMRMLPVPFIRLGLSNIVVMYLILESHPMQAIFVNLTKSVIGGVLTFNLLTPGTLLSVCGGLAAIISMWFAYNSKVGFSTYGVSICGALAHNFVQLVVVQRFVLPDANVFVLTPILLLLALFSGILTAWILLSVQASYDHLKTGKDEDKE